MISGFLISSILIESSQCGSFSFIEFYFRRIRRIFPALLLVILVCYAIGWNSFFQSEFKSLNKHIVGGAAFISNLILWSEFGYFDAASYSKALLHLWSLGIEEQFYIFWPLIIWLTVKRKLSLPVVIGVIALSSLILNVWQLQRDAVGAFYSPLARFWELLIGSMLACLALNKRKIIGEQDSLFLISPLGVIFLGVGFVLIDTESKFPGWWALLPTTGTALIISGGKNHGLIA